MYLATASTYFGRVIIKTCFVCSHLSKRDDWVVHKLPWLPVQQLQKDASFTSCTASFASTVVCGKLDSGSTALQFNTLQQYNSVHHITIYDDTTHDIA